MNYTRLSVGVGRDRSISTAKRHFKSCHKKEFAELFGDDGDPEQITNHESDPSDHGPPARVLWKYLQEDELEPKYVFCLVCQNDKRLSIGVGRNRTLSAAKRHFKSCHKKEFAELFGDDGDPETDSAHKEEFAEFFGDDGDPETDSAQIINDQSDPPDPAGPPARVLWKYLSEDEDDPKYVFCLVCPDNKRSVNYLNLFTRSYSAECFSSRNQPCYLHLYCSKVYFLKNVYHIC